MRCLRDWLSAVEDGDFNGNARSRIADGERAAHLADALRHAEQPKSVAKGFRQAPAIVSYREHQLAVRFSVEPHADRRRLRMPHRVGYGLLRCSIEHQPDGFTLRA